MPLGETARLRRIPSEHIACGRVEMADRYLHVDGYAVHLATGRVTRDDDPIEITLPEGKQARPLPFLPYDEKLLERIVRTVEELLGGLPQHSA